MAIRPGQLAFMPPEMARRLFAQGARPAAPTSQVQRRTYPTYGPGPRAGQPKPPYMDAAQLAAAAAQARTPTRLPMPMEQAAMRAAQMGPGARPTRGAAPAPPAPTIGQRLGTAFRQPLTSPTGMGIMSAALTGLEQAGPQPVPTSTGQILARMGAAGLQAYGSAQEAEAAKKMAERKLGLEERRLDIDRVRAMAAMAPNKTTLEKNLLAAGYKPGTPEYEEAVRAFLQKPSGTTITLDQKTEEEYQKRAVEYAFKRLGEADKAVNNLRAMEGELQTIVNITSIDGKADTGPMKETILGVRQIAASLGLLSDEEMEKLSDEELLQRSMYKIIPNMRVSGSGSSSDKDMNNFRMAAPNFSRTALGNRKIAQGMLQIIEQEKKARRLMDQYMKDNKGSLVGFDEYADEQLGDIFKKYDIYADEEAAAKKYEEDYKAGRIEIGDLYFNGRDYVFVTPESVEGY